MEKQDSRIKVYLHWPSGIENKISCNIQKAKEIKDDTYVLPNPKEIKYYE